MPIYERSARELTREMVQSLNLGFEGTFERQDAYRWFAENYPKIKVGTISCQITSLSTNARGRVYHKIRPVEDDLLYQIDSSTFRQYRPGVDPPPLYADSSPQAAEKFEEPESQPNPCSTEFAYEADLRDYLARNLQLIEPGLRLFEEEGVTGIEYPVGNRYIDILAINSSGALVVIELKVSRGYDRVVGQLMRYMAWIQKNQAEKNQSVRGVIVARKISSDLQLATSLLSNVSLFEYELSLKLMEVPA